MDCIVKDLKSLEKRYVSDSEKVKNQLKITASKVQKLETENSQSKKELEDMKSKIERLEKENSKLKSDLEASDSDRTLYYNQYQKNGKEVRKLKTENESLKAKIKLLESPESSQTKKDSESTRVKKRKIYSSADSSDDEREREMIQPESSDDEEYEIIELMEYRLFRLFSPTCGHT